MIAIEGSIIVKTREVQVDPSRVNGICVWGEDVRKGTATLRPDDEECLKYMSSRLQTFTAAACVASAYA